VGNRSPPERLAKASASSGLAKQNTAKSLSSRRREYVCGVADRRPVAQNITSRFLRPRTFSAGVMRPVSLKVGTGDFAFSTDHRRIAIGFVVGTLRSKPTPAAAAAFRRPNRPPVPNSRRLARDSKAVDVLIFRRGRFAQTH
jgi:hypothetical protein